MGVSFIIIAVQFRVTEVKLSVNLSVEQLNQEKQTSPAVFCVMDDKDEDIGEYYISHYSLPLSFATFKSELLYGTLLLLRIKTRNGLAVASNRNLFTKMSTFTAI